MDQPPLYPVWDHQRSDLFWEQCRQKVAELRERDRQQVNLSTLTPGQKRRVWEYIKIHEPQLAAMLSDTFVQEAMAMFDADVHIDIKIVMAALGGIS
ncbi:MAG: hypothetical protein ABTR07_05870 [Candidatus Competibacter denitrificans]